MWSSFVDLIRVTIFSASHACGGSVGGGILLVSFAVRLGLMPWTLRWARRALEQQRRIAALAPEIQRLKDRWAKDPARLFQATQALYTRNGIRLVDPSSLLGTIAQAPLFIGLFSAIRSGLGAKVRFLWIADLAQPNALLLLLVATATGGAMMIAPAPQGTSISPWFPAIAGVVMTLIFLSTTSSALALSMGAGSAASAVQGILLRRSTRQS